MLACGTALVSALIWYQVGGRILTESWYGPGRTGPKIIVREIQQFGFSPSVLVGTLLRYNPKVYRFEYYEFWHLPLFSCQTFGGKSFETTKARVTWRRDGSFVAEVILGEALRFECVKGWWRETALLDKRWPNPDRMNSKYPETCPRP